MNIFKKIYRYFKPEYHFFMLKNGEDLELRVYKNGVRVSQKELLTTKRGSQILSEYLNDQQTKESIKSKKDSKENSQRTN